MSVNYYRVLGIATWASADEIRAAFRRRSKELHPDVSGLGSTPFVQLQEAYAVLSDPDRRREYDRVNRPPEALRPKRRPASGPMVAPPPIPPTAAGMDAHGQVPSPFDQLFEELWRGVVTFTPPEAAQRTGNFTAEVVVSPDEARRGGRVRVRVPAQRVCSVCGGHGGIGGFACRRCGGRGGFPSERWTDVEYPAGLRDRYRVRIPLRRFGLANHFLTVEFRVNAGAAHWEP